MRQHLKNIFHLGVKELIELLRDKCMMVLIVYAFSLGIHIAAIGTPDSVTRAPIAVVDEDNTQLSCRISEAFLPPIFLKPKIVPLHEIDAGLDSGEYTFAVVIPADFQKNCLTGKQPELQVNVDATQMTQAFLGASYIQEIIQMEVKRFLAEESGEMQGPAELDLRDKFNANLTPTWFGGVNQMVNSITLLAIVLIGAALIRERERGTLEHLMVMPVAPIEVMCAKIWSMLVVVLIAVSVAVIVVLQWGLDMPIDGSIPLFLVGVSLHLFAVTCIGIFLACVAENMPQMGILFILVLLPMNYLSGGVTPRESMPEWVQDLMLAAPTTHMVRFCQQILFRGAGWEVVWKPYLALFIIGIVLFLYSLKKFNKLVT